MRAEDLKGWLIEASREIDPVMYQWQLLVQIIQTNFKYGSVMEEVAWDTMVFIPKGRGGVSGDRPSGLRKGGQFSDQEECDAARRTT